ncbi:uncharacterized protein LOC142803429 [Rhipicephalus microplus]|uniref:uncharacterized protein LOC142803429 n=1 Tax=Rhipicephalus microplus TaxID=6941 RepID=UPI003F6CDC2C
MASSQGATTASSIGTNRVVAAVLILAAVAFVAYLVLGPPGSRRNEVLIGRNAVGKRRAAVVDNSTENVVTEEDEHGQATETDIPDSDWIPAEEEARKMAARSVIQAPASRKGRRRTPHQSFGAGRNRSFVAAMWDRRAATSFEFPARLRSVTRHRTTFSTSM